MSNEAIGPPPVRLRSTVMCRPGGKMLGMGRGLGSVMFELRMSGLQTSSLDGSMVWACALSPSPDLDMTDMIETDRKTSMMVRSWCFNWITVLGEGDWSEGSLNLSEYF